MIPEDLKEIIATMPSSPGVYKYFDAEQQLIYVGKAKNIKKRVSSYFNKSNHLDTKTRRLVSQINSIQYTIVNAEFEAYLLENNLIKQHQPKYNILLKDDKTYPYVYVSKERFPRVISTRVVDRSLGTYYGPFTSVKAMNNVLELIRKLFTIRTCNYVLSEKNIRENKFKVCLEFHLGNCKAPCVGNILEEEYNKNIGLIHSILKGKLTLVRNLFKEEMNNYAATLDFEKAQNYKIKLDSLDRFHSSSQVVNPNISDLEVFTILSNDSAAAINYFQLMDGIVMVTKTMEIKKKLEETDDELLSLAIIEIRSQMQSVSREILTNIELADFPKEMGDVCVPQRGDKKHLVDLSVKNSFYQLHKPKEENRQESRTRRILEQMKTDLQLTVLPDHIECFDNSNIQGSNPVAAMVCFKEARPSKKDYRHFHIKTVVGPNDFDSMYEIVSRRYKRVLEENLLLPKLIIIDGGKGQLSAACQALQDLNIYGQVAIIGIAKRLEEIYYPSDSAPLFISKKSETLKLIQQIRDETHRFAITFHRDVRSKKALVSELEQVKGIGKSTFELLMKEFKTVEGVKSASAEILTQLIGAKKSLILQSYWSQSLSIANNAKEDLPNE